MTPSQTSSDCPAGVPPQKRQPKLSLRELQKEMTRQRIIESAVAVFDENGFISTTLEEVATAAVLSRPTIYLHFGNKVDILRAAVAQLPEIDPLLRSILGAQGRDERHAAFEALDDYWREHLGPVWKFVREAGAVDPEMGAWIKRFAEDQTTMIQRSLERAGVPPSAARARAFLIWCSWHEYIDWVDRGVPHVDRPAAIDALTDQFEAAMR